MLKTVSYYNRDNLKLKTGQINKHIITHETTQRKNVFVVLGFEGPTHWYESWPWLWAEV